MSYRSGLVQNFKVYIFNCDSTHVFGVYVMIHEIFGYLNAICHIRVILLYKSKYGICF